MNDLQHVLYAFREAYAACGDSRFWIYVVPGEYLRSNDSLQSIGYASFREEGCGSAPGSWHFAVEQSRCDVAKLFQCAAAEAASRFDGRIREAVERTTPCGATAQWLTAMLLQDTRRLEPFLEMDGPEPQVLGWCWTNPFTASIATMENWIDGRLSFAPVVLPHRRLTAVVGWSGVLRSQRRFAAGKTVSVFVPVGAVKHNVAGRRQRRYEWRTADAIPTGFDWFIEGAMQDLADAICWNSKATTKRNRQLQNKLANSPDMIGVQISGQTYRVYFKNEARHRDAKTRLDRLRKSAEGAPKGTPKSAPLD